MFSTPSINELVSTLEDANSPIGKRMRAAYYSKQIISDGKDDDKTTGILLNMLKAQLLNPGHGSLLRHEFAYILGQLQNPDAIPVLESVVANTEECVMVRHEAAEALGAIAHPSSIPLLESHIDESVPKELADTCVLSVRRIRQQQENSQSASIVACPCSTKPFLNTIDPALVSEGIGKRESEESVDELQSLLACPDTDIVERYRAMFALRNRGAVEALCKVLQEDKSSSLLRHELAFVLGQLQSPKSIDCLMDVLARLDEHIMVRHEAAEALGAIDGCSSEQWKHIEDTLYYYQKDPIQAIAESCLVALDAADYWGHSVGEDDAKSDDEDILLFRQQKNQSAGIESSTVRKEILNQHFNVAKT